MQLLTLKALAKELSQQMYYTNVETIPAKDIENIFNINYKYDSEKHATNAKNNEIKNPPDMPIWYITRGDSNGPYLLLITVQENKLNEYQQIVYNKIVDIWNKIK